MPPSSVLPFGETACRRGACPRPCIAMTPRRPRGSVTSQTKPPVESIPVAAAVTYVLRSCREPICAAITPPKVCVRSGFTHFSFSVASWFGEPAVGGFYVPTSMVGNALLEWTASFDFGEETHEMVEEEAIVERKTGIVKCKGLALVRGSGDDYLSDAHIFKVSTWITELVRTV